MHYPEDCSPDTVPRTVLVPVLFPVFPGDRPPVGLAIGNPLPPDTKVHTAFVAWWTAVSYLGKYTGGKSLHDVDNGLFDPTEFVTTERQLTVS